MADRDGLRPSGSVPGHGVDLHLDLRGGDRRDPSRGGVRSRLEGALREAIRAGRLGPGTRLPSSRQLARDLGLARNTVADGYTQLVAEGWLTARQGSGTVVTGHGAAEVAPARVDPAPPPRYDLRAGVPDVASFPATGWVTALRRALGTAPTTALGYGPAAGQPELREALSGYLARVRGVYADPERVVVCSGFTQALALLGRVLRQRGGRRVAVENYSQRAHRGVLTAQGLELDPIPIDEEGLDVSRLGSQQAVLLTAAHQFLLGHPLSAARRTRLVAWAAASGALVVEDDYDGEFRYDRHPVGALQGLAPEQVAYVGTVSKSLAPGVRLGWVVLPSGWVADVVAAKTVTDGQTGVLDQLALTRLIMDGGYDRHLRRMRLSYRRRRDALVTALARDAPRRPPSAASRPVCTP